MMTMMIKIRYVLVFLLFIPAGLYGQANDFGIWYGVSAEHKVTKKLDIDLSTNIRTFNKAAKVEEAFLEAGVTYDLSKRFALSGSYRVSKNIEKNGSYYFQHKLFIDLKGNIPVGNFSFSCRARLQERTKTFLKDEQENPQSYTGRIKVKANYKTPVFPLNPYVYIETFSPMFSERTKTIEKERFSAGVELSISRHNSVELEYIFQRDYLPHLSDLNIISANYNIKF